MTDAEARRVMVHVVLDWLNGDSTTDHFIKSYWTTRHRLLDSNWSAFTGPFGQAMSAMDTAADSYRPGEGSEFEIDETQLRAEAEAVIDRLRSSTPEVLQG